MAEFVVNHKSRGLMRFSCDDAGGVMKLNGQIALTNGKFYQMANASTLADKARKFISKLDRKDAGERLRLEGE